MNTQTTRQAEYFCMVPEDGTLVYVSTDMSNPLTYYESFRLYMGRTGEVMRRIPVLRATRDRCSGATIIETTTEKAFGFPSPPYTEHDPSPEWGDMEDLDSPEMELAWLNVDEYSITETDDQVTITKK